MKSNTHVPKKIFLTVPEAKAFVEKCSNTFGIPNEVFYQKLKRGRPLKTYNGTSLSEIKRAVAFRLRNETVLSLCQIANVVGFSDHTSVITTCRKAIDFIIWDDVKFSGYYRKIVEISLNDYSNKLSD